MASDSGLNSSDTEEMCGDVGAMATAGLSGAILITIGVLFLLTCLIAAGLEFRGTTLPFAAFYPFCAAGTIFLGFVAWYLLMPDPPEGSDPSLGLSGWFTLTSIFLATGAGGIRCILQPMTNPLLLQPRSRAHAHRPRRSYVTSDATAREVVLRETAMGNQTLSIVEDGDLFRITRAIRGESGTHSEDLFMSRMDALCGFTHARFDWLDTTRYLWNLLAISGLVLTILAFENPSLIFYTNWFILMFAAGTIFSMLQFADPELITFETNTGKHRLLIYRAGSNRQLTNVSMDIIDSIMRDALRGEQIDPSPLNAVADAIEEEMAEARRAAEEAAAAAEAARIQAAAMAQAQAEHQAQLEAQALEQARAQIASATPPPAQAPSTPPVGAAPAAPPPVVPAPTAPPPVAATPAPPPVAATPAPPSVAPTPSPVLATTPSPGNHPTACIPAPHPCSNASSQWTGCLLLLTIVDGHGREARGNYPCTRNTDAGGSAR